MIRFCVAYVLALLSGIAAGAPCPPHAFSAPAQVRLRGDSVLIVTHATSTHDARYSTKRGADEAVRFAKDHDIPVIYLQDDTAPQHYFMDDRKPSHWVQSQDGEIRFDVPPTHLYIAGGHLEMCLSVSLHDVLYGWAKKPPRDLTVTYLMDAIYSNDKLVEPGDPFYEDFQRFMGVVTHGRPGGEHWPKLNLLETMGVIVREEHELEYVRKILPHRERTIPASFRVEVQLNDSVRKVLRPGADDHPPTLLFQFVNSAVNLGARMGHEM